MTNGLGAKPTIDTTDFQSGIKQMNSELRVLESGFKSSAAALGNWSATATGLEARAKSLTAQMEIQTQKVAATRAEWERVKKEKGENSLAANALEIKLNKETETLNKMGNELQTTDAALEEMKNGTQETGEALDEMETQTEATSESLISFSDVLGVAAAAAKMAVAAIVAVAAAALAAAAAIAGMVFSAAKSAGELEDLSAKTGMSTERLQELSFIGGQVGVSLDTIAGAQARLVRSMNEGRDGTGAQAEAFKKLGVSVTDASGNLRNTQDVFNQTIDALGKIENPAERDAMAMAIFGKSAQELNPLIKAGSAGLADMADEAHKLGAVMSEEDVAALAAFDDMLAGLQAGLKGTLGTLATIFLPTFTLIFGQVGDVLKEFKSIVDGADGDFGKLAEGLGGLVTKIATNVAAQAPQMLSAGLSVIQSLLNAVLSALPSLLKAGSEILKSIVGFIVTALPLVIPAALQIILSLVDAIISNLPMLLTAAIQAIVTLALGLAQAAPQLIPAIVGAVLLIVNTLIQNLPLLIQVASVLIVALAQGLAEALPLLMANSQSIVPAIAEAILASLPVIAAAAGLVILTLAQALAEGMKGAWVGATENFLAGLGVGAVQWYQRITTTATQFIAIMNAAFKGVYEVGKNIVLNIFNGLSDSWAWLTDQVSNMVSTVVDAATNAVSGATGTTTGSTTTTTGTSPRMAAVGKNIAQGLLTGFQSEWLNVERQLSLSLANVPNLGVQGAAAGVVASTSNQSEYYSYYAPVTIVQSGGSKSGADVTTGRRF